MVAFKNLSIRTKIILLIVIVSTINIILASIAHYYYERLLYNKELKQKLRILNYVIGENNSSAIIFENKNESKTYLKILNADNDVQGAVILLNDSSLFAEYKNSEKIHSLKYNIPLTADTSIFDKDVLINSKPIYYKGERIATLRIAYSLSEYKKKEKQYFIVILYIIALSIFTGTLLAFLLQGGITKPIFNLYHVMNRISFRKDYSIRSEIKSNDEIGKLASGFNFMIGQIEQQNNELKEAKNQSDTALKIKERFLANMTHELRTPLTSIVGLSSLLEETELNNEQKEYLQNIKHSSDHLLAIINDLLEFSKLGTGKLQLEKSQFSVRKTIERIERSMEFELRNRKLSFLATIDESVPHSVIGDEYRLNQILINLVGNAIKFTPSGSIRIEVNTHLETLETIVLEFWVIDTGIGILKEKQDIIFESFTQESGDTNRKYGGTGLGLAITKQLIEIQKGSIRVQSEKGEGSSFIFTIPYQKNIIPESDKYKDQLFLLENSKVLLVDDNPMNLLFTKSILDKNNFITETCDNGDEALRKLENGDFHIILLDLHMPKLDGYEVCRIIRKFTDKKKSKIPIIALTAAATLNEIKKCFDSGMNDYLVKPFKKEELLAKIISLLLNHTSK
jgi:two-component system, sensor histidine kinase